MEIATHPAQPGFAHFIAQADLLAHFLLVSLLAMPVITWYLIVSKRIANRRTRNNTQAFLERFWNASGLAAVGEALIMTALGPAVAIPGVRNNTRVDNDVPRVYVARIMSDAARAGLSKLGFVTEPRNNAH